jgi:ATP-dependent RNA helicase RhlE
MTTFATTWLNQNLLDALIKQWYSQPTPIQAQAIPMILSGKDVFGCAQTGTGKTAAFSLPILQLLSKEQPKPGSIRSIRALILTPTRELAIQIGENIAEYGVYTKLKHTVIFGWVSQVPQVKALRSGVDILVATPGRLLDLINQKIITLGQVQIFTLDEADRMLDMGFIHDIRRILPHLPMRRQNLFFSATMAPTIMDLANTILRDPVSIEVTPNSSTVETIDQSLYTVAKENKRELLLHLLRDPAIKNAIVFSKTKHWANKIEKILAQANIPSAAIHGNKSQTARQTALAKLKNGQIRVLVATDIAARGIDVDLLSHVIIYDVPLEPESYVHRIGRTGRAQATGQAIMFCEPEELKYLQQVLKLIGQEIPLVTDHPYHHKISLSNSKSPWGGTARPNSIPKPALSSKGGKPDRGSRPNKVRYDRSPKQDAPRSSRNDTPRRSDRGPRQWSSSQQAKPNNPSKSGRYY